MEKTGNSTAEKLAEKMHKRISEENPLECPICGGPKPKDKTYCEDCSN